MTQAPEHIWARGDHRDGWMHGHAFQTPTQCSTLYTRADLAPRWRPIEEWDGTVNPETVFWFGGVTHQFDDATHFTQLTPPDTP